MGIRFDLDTLVAHEAKLYPLDQRLTLDYLVDTLGSYPCRNA